MRQAQIESGLGDEAWMDHLHCLLLTLPSVQRTQPFMYPRLIAELVRDAPALAGRLVTVKRLLPGLDVQSVLLREPRLLRSQEWPAVEEHLRDLLKVHSAPVIESWLQMEPELLHPTFNAAFTGQTVQS